MAKILAFGIGAQQGRRDFSPAKPASRSTLILMLTNSPWCTLIALINYRVFPRRRQRFGKDLAPGWPERQGRYGNVNQLTGTPRASIDPGHARLPARFTAAEISGAAIISTKSTSKII